MFVKMLSLHSYLGFVTVKTIHYKKSVVQCVKDVQFPQKEQKMKRHGKGNH